MAESTGAGSPLDDQPPVGAGAFVLDLSLPTHGDFRSVPTTSAADLESSEGSLPTSPTMMAPVFVSVHRPYHDGAYYTRSAPTTPDTSLQPPLPTSRRPRSGALQRQYTAPAEVEVIGGNDIVDDYHHHHHLNPHILLPAPTMCTLTFNDDHFSDEADEEEEGDDHDEHLAGGASSTNLLLEDDEPEVIVHRAIGVRTEASSSLEIVDDPSSEDSTERVIASAGVDGPVCAICLGWEKVERRPCCGEHACVACIRFHVATQVGMGVLAIECLSCDATLPEHELLTQHLRDDPTLARKYKMLKRMRAQALRKTNRAGGAGHRHQRAARRAADATRQAKIGLVEDGERASVSGTSAAAAATRAGPCVTSDDSDYDDSESETGSDDDETGTDAESENMAAWAEGEDHVTGLANARRCPECQIYIQKRAGCYNIKCPLCGVKFCYKCGERLPHDMSLHRNRNLTVHRPWVRCHGLGLCCSKFCSGLRDCCCSRRWLQVVRLGLCFILLALLALLVLHLSGIVL